MPDQKLSQLPAGVPILDTDLFYSDQLGNSVSQQGLALATYMQSKIASAGTIYYISAAGSDSNNGLSPQTPWATIAKVNSILFPNPGTSFLFRGGDTFTGTITINAGGLPGAPIAYSSYGSGQATISPGNASAITGTDFGNIAITNLILNGSGLTTNTGHGIFFNGVARSCQNFLISGLTIANFGFMAVYFTVGGVAVPIFSNITITNCTAHDCGQNGIQGLTNNAAGSGLPQFAAFNNVLVDHCTVFNITGQNNIVLTPGAFGGTAVVFQGVNGYTVQFCNIFQNAGKSQLSNGGTGASGPAVYTANASNVLWQFNEVWGQGNPGSGHDGGALMADFGINNTLVQYNYVHDNQSFGFATGTLTLSNGANNNVNTTFRYNVVANNGAVPGAVLPIGIALYTFTGAESITGLAIYNNTIVAKGGINVGSQGGLIDASIGHAGTMSGVIANNILNGDANTMLALLWDDGLRLIGNDYVGGSTVRKIYWKGSTFATIAAWQAGTTPPQETVDGASVLVTPGLDPLLNGAYPIASPIAGGYVPGRVTNFELSASSPVTSNGIDLTSTLAFQAAAPPVGFGSGIDFDFKGGLYTGDVIGSITCTRAATSATDLLPTSPLGATFNTFGANTLRITAGKGLLVEEARTQFLANPGAPATQTTASLANGQYIVWVNGSGSAVVSAGTATINSSNGIFTAVLGRPVIFGVTAPGTVVVTVNGSLNQFQLENDPVGIGLATSFISAIGTRDADVVSTTTATTIGLMLNNYLGGGLGGNPTSYVEFFFNIPLRVNFASNAILIEDSNNLSFVGLQDHGLGAFNQPFQAIGIAAVGTATLQSTNSISFNTRQTIAARTDAVNGQALVVDGGTIVLNASATAPAIGTTTFIGNRSAHDQALNGYIERITAERGSNVLSAATLQANTTTVPIATGLTQDFFGNQVASSAGKYSIGAHQPAGGGGGGTPGGTSGQVQYNNAGAFGGFGFWDGTVALSIANGATAEALRVYHDVDNVAAPTNYTRGVLDYTTNPGQLTIGSQKGGTGSNLGVKLISGDNTVFDMTAGGTFWLYQVSGNNKLAIYNPSAWLSLLNSGVYAFDPSASNAGGLSFDSGIGRVAPGVIRTIVDSSGAVGGYMQWGGEARVTSDFTVTSSTALTNVTGLTVNVSAGRTYKFSAQILWTDAAAGGIQAAIAGTATATNIIYNGWIVDSAANGIKGNAQATALGTAVANSTTTGTAGHLVIEGTITVNAAGTLTVQIAQNTSNGTATTAKRGSSFLVHDMP